MEPKYRGMVVVACEVVWLKRILTNLGVPIKDLILLYCDNMTSIDLGTRCSTHIRSISKCTTTSSEIAFSWRCRPTTHRHQPSYCRHLNKSRGSRQALTIHSSLGFLTSDLPSLRVCEPEPKQNELASSSSQTQIKPTDIPTRQKADFLAIENWAWRSVLR